jgi:uncharacterized protein YjiS (DUF1127 family)
VSNRLLQIGRVPLMPDPQVALQASSLFESSKQQTDQVFALGRAFRQLPGDIWRVFQSCAQSVHNATRIRTLSSMNDRALSDIGLRRDQIPMLFVDQRSDRLKQPSAGWDGIGR